MEGKGNKMTELDKKEGGTSQTYIESPLSCNNGGTGQNPLSQEIRALRLDILDLRNQLPLIFILSMGAYHIVWTVVDKLFDYWWP